MYCELYYVICNILRIFKRKTAGWLKWFLLGFQGNPEGPIGTLVQSQRAVQEENNELLSENLDRRRQQLFRQDMGSRLKSKIYTSAIAA